LILGVLAFGLIVLGVVIVLVVVPSLGLQDSGTNTPIPSQDVTRSPVAEEGPVDETTNVTEVAAETPEATLSSTPPISPSLPKPTESPTPVVPQVFLLGAHWDSESQACLYKVKDGDNALDITKSFLSSEEINENKQDQLVKEVYIHILEKDIWEIVGDVLDREDVL
jgi:hypothetical protein